MRLGVYGGAFDPVHHGHLVLAEQCREQCRLDQVWFLPTRIPAHKPAAALTDACHRVEMLKLALAGTPYFQVCDLELNRPGTSWMVDTLRDIRAAHPQDELFLLIGADSLRDFHSWREPDEIASQATIVAVNRGRMGTQRVEQSEYSGPTSAVAAPEIPPDRIQHVTMPGIDISATDLRERAATGRSLRFLVPRAVERYIVQHRLYEPGSL